MLVQVPMNTIASRNRQRFSFSTRKGEIFSPPYWCPPTRGRVRAISAAAKIASACQVYRYRREWAQMRPMSSAPA